MTAHRPQDSISGQPDRMAQRTPRRTPAKRTGARQRPYGIKTDGRIITVRPNSILDKEAHADPGRFCFIVPDDLARIKQRHEDQQRRLDYWLTKTADEQRQADHAMNLNRLRLAEKRI